MRGEVKESVQCKALTKNGTRCRRQTVYYPKLCGQHTPDLQLKKSTIRGAGKGLFAKRRIEDGETIGKYKGERMSQRAFDEQVPESDYGFLLKKNVVIDAKNTQSCLTRNVNDAHGTTKTINARFVKNFRNQTARVVATRPIQRLKEILISYGPAYWA